MSNESKVETYVPTASEVESYTLPRPSRLDADSAKAKARQDERRRILGDAAYNAEAKRLSDQSNESENAVFGANLDELRKAEAEGASLRAKAFADHAGASETPKPTFVERIPAPRPVTQPTEPTPSTDDDA